MAGHFILWFHNCFLLSFSMRYVTDLIRNREMSEFQILARNVKQEIRQIRGKFRGYH